jgi:hypothetical protein
MSTIASLDRRSKTGRAQKAAFAAIVCELYRTAGGVQ